MSDFEQWLKTNYPDHPPPLSEIWEAAKQSMQGECIAAKVSRQPDGRLHFTTPDGRYFDINEHIGGIFYTHAPDSAALIAEQAAEIARLTKELKEARKGLKAIETLIQDSEGVAGLHLNGDVAPWHELRTGGRFESWLLDFDAAISKIGGAE